MQPENIIYDQIEYISSICKSQNHEIKNEFSKIQLQLKATVKELEKTKIQLKKMSNNNDKK